MVKNQNNNSSKIVVNQGEKVCPEKANKIASSTAYEYCSERLSSFGGLLGLVKFMDVVKFEEIINEFYTAPTRSPDLGHYNMLYGIIILLFIGFNRIWHFIYIQLDPMLCGIFKVVKLPYVTTYWRYVDSMGINQGKSLLNVMSALRERVWHLCDINYKRIHINLDTTVETIYGKQQGGRKGHNTKNRGKKGFRPVLSFIEETREYLSGKLRKGETISGKEVAEVIRGYKKYIPGCVEEIIIRGDGEFIGCESVEAAEEEGYDFIFGNKVCNPPFEESKWYKTKEKDNFYYNECIYQPINWKHACRFVVMRIPKEETGVSTEVQLELLEDNKYKYRIFVTSLKEKAHKVIEEYDNRADCENLIGESKREGLEAIPSNKFANNYAYFQVVMLAYNIWRSFKMLAEHSLKEGKKENNKEAENALSGIMNNTIRIARLKLLFIAAKIPVHSNTNKVKYSEHDNRVASFFGLLKYLDKLRGEISPWLDSRRWRSRHIFQFDIHPIAQTG